MTPATKGGRTTVLMNCFALAAGILSVFSFAPFDFSILAPISLLMLFWSWQRASVARATLRGYLFGLGQFGAGTGWVFISMHDYGGANLAESASLTVLFMSAFSLYPALAGYLSARMTPSSPLWWPAVLCFPVCWIGVEWFRGWFLTGFPWLQIGYSQVDNVLGQGLAPIGGTYAVSFAVAIISGLLLSILDHRQPRQVRIISVLAIAALMVVSGRLSQIQWTQPAAPPVSVALLQGNISQDAKWRAETKQTTLAKYREMTRENWDAGLVVWPETAIPAFLHEVQDGYLAELRAEAIERGTDVLIGIPLKNLDTGRYYNGLISLTSDTDAYYKRHMVPFGEFLPLRSVFGFVLEMLQIPLADFEGGADQQTALRAAGYPLAASICFEDVFGYEIRKGLPEAAYLVNVTNDAWFGDSIEPYQHLQMARMRAMEGGRYLMRATNTGVTAIISPMGKVVSQLPIFREGVLRGTFRPIEGVTPYVRFGDGPVIVLLAGLAAFSLFRKWQGNNEGCGYRGAFSK